MRGNNVFEKKEEFISSGSAETIVGTSVKLKGNLKSEGNITINGSINGEVKTKGSVTIGPEANIIANVIARDVTVSGTVQGNIQAKERLNITETGRVYGDVSANILSISAGAIFSGKSIMVENIKDTEIEPVIEKDEIIEEELVLEEQ
jgi:cytoskeletal protein CcmA (bactofilin family)